MAQQDIGHLIGLEQLAAALATGLDQWDTHRAALLTELAAAREARGAVLAREQVRLTAKLGAEHPRVRAIAAEIEINGPLVRDLRLEAETAVIPTAVPESDTWIVHGHVRDAQGEGIAGLTVAPYTEQGVWDQAMGYACTDRAGYYRLETKRVTGAPRRLHVIDQAGDDLLADDLPLSTTPGTAVYRLLISSEGANPCVSPSKSTANPVPLPGGWVVRGHVTDANGRPVPGVIVTIYDKDLFFDDRLGQIETDTDGSYLLGYRAEDFRDLIERKPDLYVEVRRRDGEVLYRSTRPIRWDVGAVEIIDVKLH